jgi:hypothetical protein
MAAQAYNPSYWGGRDRKEQFEVRQGKKFMRPQVNQWLAWWHASVIPTVARSINRRIMVQASPGINTRPYLKNNQSKKRAGVMTQAVQHLLSERVALTLNPSTTNKKDPILKRKKINGSGNQRPSR